MRPELVIFDCDGVLVDSEPVTDAVIAANLTRHGLPMTPDRVHSLFVGGTILGVRHQARRLGATLPDDWADQMYAEMFEALAKGVPLIPGILPLLDALDGAGIAKAIASNGPRQKMEITLTPSGLWDRFAPNIHSAHDAQKPKPDPHMLLKAVAQAGTTPDRSVFIDDSPTGAAAGPAAGIRTFALTPDPDRAPPGTEQITSLTDLSAALGLAEAL